MDKNSLSHTTWNCKYHLVFAPKFRRQEIYGKLKTDIKFVDNIRSACKPEIQIRESALLVQRVTRKYPLSASDLTEHSKRRIRQGLCAGRQAKRSRAWRASISTSFATHSRAICSQTGQRQRMCRSFSDTPMSVHNVHLRSRCKRSEAYFRKTAG